MYQTSANAFTILLPCCFYSKQEIVGAYNVFLPFDYEDNFSKQMLNKIRDQKWFNLKREIQKQFIAE